MPTMIKSLYNDNSEYFTLYCGESKLYHQDSKLCQ